MNTQALLIEMLLSGFFAIACFRARAEQDELPIAPRGLFVLTDRIERLRRSRWQWFSMVLVLIFARLQQGSPLIAELTVLAQLFVFVALPSQKAGKQVIRAR